MRKLGHIGRAGKLAAVAYGVVGVVDAKITAARPLRFFAYAWGELSAPLAKTQSDAVERLGNLGYYRSVGTQKYTLCPGGQ